MEPELTKVRQLGFSDLYLGHPWVGDRFSDVPGANASPLLASEALKEDLDGLKAACVQAKRTAGERCADFKVVYDEVEYRVSMMNTLGGEVFIIRRIAGYVQSLFDLGIPAAYIRHLMVSDLTGLFIVSGGIRAGKTMTACSLMRERLIQYGGVAVTVEDPIELPLEGSHGLGVCYQTHYTMQSGGCVEAFRHAQRSGARIILVGEVIDHEVAAEVLQASLSGHLVITTLHADSVIKTIVKLHALANEKLDSLSVQALLSDGLTGVLHQNLVGTTRKKLETEFLFLKDAGTIKTIVRNGKYELLGSEIKQQMANMIAENAAARRQTGS